MDDRVLREIKDRLELPDGKYTDEEIAKAYSGTMLEGQIKMSLAFRDLIDPIANFFASIGEKVNQSSNPFGFMVFWIIVCLVSVMATVVSVDLLRAIFAA